MARNSTVSLAATTYTQLTNADAAAVRVQNQSGYDVHLMATNGTTAPTTTEGSVIIHAHETSAADLTVAHLWPYVTDGTFTAKRLWAYCEVAVKLSVCHANG
jgi:hypothetical protein